ncbi:hypothetical protein M8C21_001084, partial [Ambrosia artemisiifolia]
ERLLYSPVELDASAKHNHSFIREPWFSCRDRRHPRRPWIKCFLIHQPRPMQLCPLRHHQRSPSEVPSGLDDHLDIMFSNAGIITSNQTIIDFAMDEFDCLFVEALFAPLVVLGKIGVNEKKDYSMSKHVVVMGLMKWASKQLGQYGIRVNYVSPYVVATTLMCNTLEKEGEEVEKIYESLVERL